MFLRTAELQALLIKSSVPGGKECQLRLATVGTILTDSRGQPTCWRHRISRFPTVRWIFHQRFVKKQEARGSRFLSPLLALAVPRHLFLHPDPADEFFCLAKYVATVSNELAALYFANDRIVNHNYCERPPSFELSVSFFGFLGSVFQPRCFSM